MKTYRDYLIPPNMTVKQALEHMESHKIKSVVIVDEQDKMLGIFSPGDMRRFFCNNGHLSDAIEKAMNSNPITFQSHYDVEKYDRELIVYPIVNENNVVTDIIESPENVTSDVLKDVPVVIMAGGKGTRLYPYTKILPKPLIPIGEDTITERIIGSFRKYGVTDYYMILNYKANMIKAYFNEMEKDYNIHYAKEEKFLGTGGGLYLLKDQIHSTFFLSNCDILLNADLECIYRTHKKNGNKITMVCAMKDYVIPYGIVETDSQGTVSAMTEKPSFSFLVNTGVYVIEPEVIEELVEDEFIHMPDIAERYTKRGEKVGVFPISENAWMDMGQFNEMKAMMSKLEV